MKPTTFPICALLVSLLTACGATQLQLTKAQEATSGARARIRVSSDRSAIGMTPNRECIDPNEPGAGSVLGGGLGSNGFRGRLIGIPNPPTGKDLENDTAEFYVAADKPVSFRSSYIGGQGRSTCNVALWFIPKENEDYQVTSTLTDGYCRLKVTSLSRPEEKIPAHLADFCEGVIPFFAK